ncbi:HOL1 [Fusarium beomiforme]|uniref:HOL1 n=1 Tax=Fusarium beomiforme TaxID=44412 RepID=A0A9P5AJ88_9HYPO|nr:HOL1 [Fusarium beomiforme]
MVSFKEALALSSHEVDAATPPGTTQIHREQEDVNHAIVSAHPTDDPRDPLNFPTWHKVAALSVASLFAFVANYTSGVIAPAFQMWPMIFPKDPRSLSELSKLIAIHVLFLGAANIWWVPMSNWMGRRPVLIVSTTLLTLSALWCGLATSYDSLLAARAFQGIGGAAADTVAPALVGDMFPVHQRGRAMAVYTIMLVIGPIAGGISGGYIAFQQSWKMIFWVSLALSAACLVGVVFFVPETLYTRSAPIEGVANPEAEKNAQFAKDEQVEDRQSVTVGEQRASYSSFTYVQSLGFIKPQGSLLKQFIQPWRTLAFPGTWVVMLHYAGLVGGIVTISTIGPQLVASPPYLWKENAGLVNIGALIGGIIGYIYTSILADGRLVNKATKTRHGVAEAEDRLPTLFFPLFIATGGFLVFGFCAQNPSKHGWVGLQVGYGMISFGLMQVPSVGFNYLVDSYHSLAADCFTMVAILRAVIAFAWTFFVADWVQRSGAAEPFGIFGMLMGIFSLLTVPLWWFGKRLRIATAEKVLRWQGF